jgi:K+-sensing histidine kinase KdpD
MEQVAGAKVTRRDQESKAAVLDALAHEIKGPLMAIKMAVTTLLSSDSALGPKHRRQLLRIIERNSDRLDAWSTDAIRAVSIGAGILHLKRQPHDIRQAVRSMVAELASEFEGMSSTSGFKISPGGA